MQPPSASVGRTTVAECQCRTPTCPGWVPVPGKRWPKKAKAKVELNNIERTVPEQVNQVTNSKFLEITVASGAAENVMPEYMAPETPVEYSDEQAAGVVYSAANGDLMPNRGKKSVPIITGEGQARKVNMQITDVNRALMSVATVCDAGHTVLFTDKGG